MGDRGRAGVARVLALAGALAGVPAGLGSQQESADRVAAESGWNAARARDIARRAVEARTHAYADSSLRSLRAEAQGHVYFLGEFQGERELVRADQVALDILWQAPDRALQTIVGRRHELRLPTDIQYHIDHLSLVLDNFGDRIRLGEGQEVWNVLHPAARGALEFYEYRLADSLEIRVRDRVAKVYALDVRPSDPSRPGVVGSVYVDRASGAIARMRLTFTGAAYRDPDLESIALDFKSALWEGRYWLPLEQEVEIRREIAWLSFPMGSVIRTRIRVLDYEINQASEYRIAPGERVASLPKPALERFWQWESDLYAGPLAAGDRSDAELAAARRRARELVSPGALLGGERLRLHLPDASSGLRARRAEGVLVGGGGVLRASDRDRLTFWGGYPFGSERPEVDATFHRALGEWRVEVAGRWDRLRDVGEPAASGLLQTAALAFEGEDYTDPYFERGGGIGFSGPALGGTARIGASFAHHRSADLVMESVLIGQRSLRPVRPIDAGDLTTLETSFDRPLGRSAGTAWRLELRGEAAPAALGDFGYARGTVTLRGERDHPGAAWQWSLRLTAGAAGGDLPAQRLFLLGGRGTLPGHPFRAWGGDRLGLAAVEVSRAVWSPWIRVRGLGAAGWTDLTDVGGGAAERFGVAQTPGTRAAVGVGLGLGWDLLRVDFVRGLDGGAWELLLSLNPLLWSVL